VKALVFGAGGQVGRALTQTAPAGIALVALDRLECDVADTDAVARALHDAAPDLVINAAAYTAVDRAENDQEAAFSLNGAAPGVIASASRAAGAGFVHLSSDFVFNGAAGMAYRPQDRPDPLSVYGRSKLQGEAAVAAADPAALIVRTAWVYAAQGTNFVRTMLRLMTERDRIKVVADQIGTPTYAPSLSRALWSLGRARSRGIHHFTDAGVASWYDFAVAIFEEAIALDILRRPVEIVPIATAEYPSPARRPAFSVLDKSHTWAALGGPAPHWRVNLRACLHDISRDCQI
jgi:dTDP-4-dehydrorhamnose reductase